MVWKTYVAVTPPPREPGRAARLYRRGSRARGGGGGGGADWGRRGRRRDGGGRPRGGGGRCDALPALPSGRRGDATLTSEGGRLGELATHVVLVDIRLPLPPLPLPRWATSAGATRCCRRSSSARPSASACWSMPQAAGRPREASGLRQRRTATICLRSSASSSRPSRYVAGRWHACEIDGLLTRTWRACRARRSGRAPCRRKSLSRGCARRMSSSERYVGLRRGSITALC